MFLAKRFIYTDESKSETIVINRNFRDFKTALAWIQANTGDMAAGGSIADADTWNTVFEISPDGSEEDYR